MKTNENELHICNYIIKFVYSGCEITSFTGHLTSMMTMLIKFPVGAWSSCPDRIKHY